MPNPLINVEALQKQLEGLNIHYPTINNLISNSALIDQYKHEEKKALHHFREDLFVTCMNRMYKPFNFYRNKDNVIFSVPKKEAEFTCRGELMGLTHFHGIYPGYPSEQDIKTHSSLFHRSFQVGEVVGIDGIYIHTFLGQTFKVPWTQKFYDEIKKEGVQIVYPVQHILCSRLEKPMGKKSTSLLQCNLSVMNMQKELSFLVNQAVIQESNEYRFSPFMWIDEKDTRKIIPFDYTNKKGRCAIMQTQDKKKRIMSCFFND